MRILQQLIEKLMNTGAEIAFDMVWSNNSPLKVKKMTITSSMSLTYYSG